GGPSTPATAQPDPLSLHDALPISAARPWSLLIDCQPWFTPTRFWCWIAVKSWSAVRTLSCGSATAPTRRSGRHNKTRITQRPRRSEEHTSELQSRENLVCRLLLEK